MLIEEEDPGGAALLYRYAANAEFAGDTWHGCLEDAVEQARYEYGTALGAWLAVPAEVGDAKVWVCDRLGRQ